MFSTAIFFLALSSVSFASPLEPRYCTPNFWGNPLTIFSQPSQSHSVGTLNVWDAINSKGGSIKIRPVDVHTAFNKKKSFLVEFTGQADSSYRFKLVADTERELALSSGWKWSDLIFSKKNVDRSQDFYVSCSTCFGDGKGARNCVIRNVRTNKCVTGNKPFETLQLKECRGSRDQLYNFAA